MSCISAEQGGRAMTTSTSADPNVNDNTTIHVNKFYGNTNRQKSRKWLDRPKAYQRLNKRDDVWKWRIPVDYHARLLGPTYTWQAFYRQRDAFEFIKKSNEDLHVFAFEKSRPDVGQNTGQRRYLVTSTPVFWHYYKQLSPDQRHHYEIIPEGKECKLYFDLEFMVEQNPNSDGPRMVDVLIQYVAEWLRLVFDVTCDRSDVLDLDASTKSKFSRHLIFQLRHVLFRENVHAGQFVRQIFDLLLRHIGCKGRTAPVPCDSTGQANCDQNGVDAARSYPNCSGAGGAQCSPEQIPGTSQSFKNGQDDSSHCPQAPGQSNCDVARTQTLSDSNLDKPIHDNCDSFCLDDSFDEEISLFEDDFFNETLFSFEIYPMEEDVSAADVKEKKGSDVSHKSFLNSAPLPRCDPLKAMSHSEERLDTSVNFRNTVEDNGREAGWGGQRSEFNKGNPERRDTFSMSVSESESESRQKSHPQTCESQLQCHPLEMDTKHKTDEIPPPGWDDERNKTDISSGGGWRDVCHKITGVSDADVASLFEKFSPDDLRSLLVNNKDGVPTLFCDLAVYTRYRNFRLYLSSKGHKQNPLVLAKENTFLPLGQADGDEAIFHASLISHVKRTPDMKVLQFENSVPGRVLNIPESSNQGIRPGGRKMATEETQDTMEGWGCLSPFVEADHFIQSLVSGQGKTGSIRHWTYFPSRGSLIYDIVGYRWCGKVRRQHRSNNIMYVVDLRRGVYYQKCYDPDCQVAAYRSEERELPRECLPWTFMSDDDDFAEEDTPACQLEPSEQSLRGMKQNESGRVDGDSSNRSDLCPRQVTVGEDDDEDDNKVTQTSKVLNGAVGVRGNKCLPCSSNAVVADDDDDVMVEESEDQVNSLLVAAAQQAEAEDRIGLG